MKKMEISAIAHHGGTLEETPSAALAPAHTCHSVNSVDDILQMEVPDDPEEAWKQNLSDRIEEIIVRKGSSGQGRENALSVYNNILMQRYAHDQLESKISEIYPALLKSVKTLDSSEKETCLALKGRFTTCI